MLLINGKKSIETNVLSVAHIYMAINIRIKVQNMMLVIVLDAVDL